MRKVNFKKIMKPLKKDKYQKDDVDISQTGGIITGNFEIINKGYDEERFHSRQGHGFAAERANNLYDKLAGRDAHITGDDNQKNGADRVVDGIFIQSKYCATGSRCINECFEDNGKGAFRYMKNGRPMQIEVPSDKYDAAIQAMEEKIRRGQVEGISDPSEAKRIVRKGHFTYEQAKNIAKAGTVESLTYDTINGVVIASSAFGVTALLTFATSIWRGDSFDDALKISAYSGLKVGGTAFAVSILAGQLSKAGLNSMLVGSSEAIINVMGPRASAVLINVFRRGSNIYGAAAMKSAAKLLRGNTITAVGTVAVLSSMDVVNMFRGRISGKQLFKNIVSTTGTTVGGVGGWVGGAGLGSVVFPGIGTIAGGIAGSLLGGAITGKATKCVVDNFIEDDAEEMVKIIENLFCRLAKDYLLSQKEAEDCVGILSQNLNGNILKNMYACDDREEFASGLLEPIISEEIKERDKIYVPNAENMTEKLREILEEISEDLETV